MIMLMRLTTNQGELKNKVHVESSLVWNSIRCESIRHYSWYWHDNDPSSLVYFYHSGLAIFFCTTFYFYGNVTSVYFLLFFMHVNVCSRTSRRGECETNLHDGCAYRTPCCYIHYFTCSLQVYILHGNPIDAVTVWMLFYVR